MEVSSEGRLFLFMRFVFSTLRVINILSLDVVAGSVSSALFFGYCFRSVPSMISMIVLALTVWIIYTSDHLLDARSTGVHASTQRHVFHQRFFFPLLIAVITALMIDLILVTQLDLHIVEAGAIVGIGVVLYVFFQARITFAKEIIAGVMYCIGVLIPVIAKPEPLVNANQWLLIGQFLCVVLMNLFLFSWFDYHQDLKQGTRSTISLIGEDKGKVIIISLFIAEIFLYSLAGFDAAHLAVLALAVMHMIIFFLPKFFSRNELYRVADSIFIVPLVFVWFN